MRATVRGCKAKDQLKQDEIAARQLHSLHAFERRQEKKLRLADVKEMFLQMRDHASPLERESRRSRPDDRSQENHLVSRNNDMERGAHGKHGACYFMLGRS